MFCVCRMRREGLSRSSSSFPLPSFLARLTPFRETGALFDHAVTCAPMKMSQSVDRLPSSPPSILPSLPEGFFHLGWSNYGIMRLRTRGWVRFWVGRGEWRGGCFQIGGGVGNQSERDSCNFLGERGDKIVSKLSALQIRYLEEPECNGCTVRNSNYCAPLHSSLFTLQCEVPL